jgi:PAS domain S-box-containing protein
MGFGMPMNMGSGTSTLQMNPDPADTIFPLDSSFFYQFGDRPMSMTLDAIDPLASTFETPPGQASSAALVGSTPQSTGFSPNDTTGNDLAQESLGAGNQSQSNGLNEFTKRPNWPARVVDVLRDLLHIFDADGRIKTVSPSAVNLTGYQPTELCGLLMQDLLHPDDVGVFTAELNQSIASGNPFCVFYRMKKKDGTYAIFEAIGHAHIAAPKFAPNPNNQTAFCQAVFMMARPYPTKNAVLLDSFLEHKMENERLKRKIAELQKEEQEDTEELERTWRGSQETTPSESGARFGPSPLQPQSDASIPPREQGTSLDGGLAEGIMGPRRSSIGVTHTDTIEMLTGLRYQEGERSRGITTGVASPTLVSGDIGMITGDVGIAIPLDRDQRTGDKKKKLKMVEEYVCTDCGTLESPEWRKGPSGPKTLCNACGLRWAKREKKKSISHGGGGGPEHSGPGFDI